MDIKKIEANLSFPMKRKKMKEQKDFRIRLKIGGGKKIAEIEFNDWKTMNEFEGQLQTIADNAAFKLELLVKTAA